MKHEEWPIDRLRDEQPHHDPDCCEAYRQEIRRTGQPLTVMAAPDGLILDGHHRARANKMEGMTTIPVHVAGPGLAQDFAEIVKPRSLPARKAAYNRWIRGEF
jgi:ParB-like nuclease domain